MTDGSHRPFLCRSETDRIAASLNLATLALRRHGYTLVNMPELPLDYSGFLGMNLQERLVNLTRIAKLDDPVLRNLLITQRYHDLSHELARVLGTGNANWSTFATWASKTAGQSIRKEEIPPELWRFLNDEAKLEAKVDRFYNSLWPIVRRFIPRLDPFDLARGIIAEVAAQIAEGNLKVYAELTPLFAEFVDQFNSPADRTEERLAAFVNKLTPGSASEGGQGDLKVAFTAYFQAAQSSDPVLVPQLVLFGNVLIGLHEQTRLQANIEGGLDAPFCDRVYQSFFMSTPSLLRGILSYLSVTALNLFASEFRDDWLRIATRYLMKLSSPNGDEISLGSDLPPGLFAPGLAKLTLAELIALLIKYDPDLLTTKGSAAVDWVKLQDRMRFIGELFRVEQCDLSWFDQPFADVQRTQIEQGRIPGGALG